MKGLIKIKNDVRKPIKFKGENLYLEVGKYYNNRLGVLSYTDKDGYYSDITVNLSSLPIFDIGGAYIDSLAKDCGLEKKLIEKGIIKEVTQENCKYNLGHYDYVIFDENKLKEYDPIGPLNMKTSPLFIYYDGKKYNLIINSENFYEQLFKKYNGNGDSLDQELVMRLFIHKNMPNLENDAWFVDGTDLNLELDNFDDAKKLSTSFSKVYNDDKKMESLIKEAMPYAENFRLNPVEFGYNFSKNINI